MRELQLKPLPTDSAFRLYIPTLQHATERHKLNECGAGLDPSLLQAQGGYVSKGLKKVTMKYVHGQF